MISRTASSSAMLATTMSCWCAAVRRFSPWARSARIIMARWLKVSSLATPFAVPGTTRVLTCVPARPCALRRCSQYPAGPWRDPITKFSCGRGALSQSKRRVRKRTARIPTRSSSSVEAPPRFAAAEMLRRERIPEQHRHAERGCRAAHRSPEPFQGLPGGFSASEDWLPLRPDAFYADNDIDLRLKTRVVAIYPLFARRADRLMARQSRMIGCCLPRAPNRMSCRFPAPTSRMSIPCAPLRTPAPSSKPHRRRARRWW